MRIFARQEKPTQDAKSASLETQKKASAAPSPDVGSILRLQRTIGNQAVLRMLRAITEGPEAGSDKTASPRFPLDFGKTAVHAKSPAGVQTKPTADSPRDICEQEADRVAEQVMRTADSGAAAGEAGGAGDVPVNSNIAPSSIACSLSPSPSTTLQRQPQPQTSTVHIGKTDKQLQLGAGGSGAVVYEYTAQAMKKPPGVNDLKKEARIFDIDLPPLIYPPSTINPPKVEKLPASMTRTYSNANQPVSTHRSP